MRYYQCPSTVSSIPGWMTPTPLVKRVVHGNNLHGPHFEGNGHYPFSALYVRGLLFLVARPEHPGNAVEDDADVRLSLLQCKTYINI